MKKEKPRKDIVLQLLKQTYTSRRQFILGDTEDISVYAILNRHAALMLPFAVSNEEIIVPIDNNYCHTVHLSLITDGTGDGSDFR